MKGGSYRMFHKSLMCFLLLPALLLSGCIITGKVTDGNGNGIEGVTVTLTGDANLTTTTNSKGGYIFGNFFEAILGFTSDEPGIIMPGNYTVTPSKTGCGFTPASIEVSVTSSTYGPLAGDIPWPVGGVNFNVEAFPLELTPDLCDDPSNMALIMASLGCSSLPSFGGGNEELLQRMIAAPTEGPFYMVNLIRYREKAEYPDGRETDLTGREANALYAPFEFLAAIGARLVFNSEVSVQIDGDDTVWEEVAIVEYPCPLAFFAMLSHPEFQARAIHKEAGVEKTIVMVTELGPSPLPEGFVPPESPYPATEEDPAFELIHVMDFHEIAQYEEGADEPERTGEEAWEMYAVNGSEAAQRVGSYPTALFLVQGVLSGDDRPWDQVQIVHMPSLQGFLALLDDETRQAGSYHREAALAHNYSLITYPSVVDIPGAPDGGGTGPLPITSDGVGTPCTTDGDCPGNGELTCLTDGGGVGFCTREGCSAGECEAPYVCCHDCSEAVASLLPFEGSACFPSDVIGQLTASPVSCTCD